MRPVTWDVYRRNRGGGSHTFLLEVQLQETYRLNIDSRDLRRWRGLAWGYLLAEECVFIPTLQLQQQHHILRGPTLRKNLLCQCFLTIGCFSSLSAPDHLEMVQVHFWLLLLAQFFEKFHTKSTALNIRLLRCYIALCYVAQVSFLRQKYQRSPCCGHVSSQNRI